MPSDLSVRGCLNAAIGLFLLLLFCFVIGLGVQLTLRAASGLALPPTATPLPAASPTPTSEPTATLTPSPTATASPSATATARPSRTPAPTATRRPSPRPSLTPTASEQRYTVQAGDTFFSIARRFGLSVAALQASNPDVTPDRLSVGDELVIPTP